MLTSAIDELLAHFAVAQAKLDQERGHLDRREEEVDATTTHPDFAAADAAERFAFDAWATTWTSMITPALLNAGLTGEQIDQLRCGVARELDRHVEGWVAADLGA